MAGKPPAFSAKPTRLGLAICRVAPSARESVKPSSKRLQMQNPRPGLALGRSCPAAWNPAGRRPAPSGASRSSMHRVGVRTPAGVRVFGNKRVRKRTCSQHRAIEPTGRRVAAAGRLDGAEGAGLVPYTTSDTTQFEMHGGGRESQDWRGCRRFFPFSRARAPRPVFQAVQALDSQIQKGMTLNLSIGAENA